MLMPMARHKKLVDPFTKAVTATAMKMLTGADDNRLMMSKSLEGRVGIIDPVEEGTSPVMMVTLESGELKIEGALLSFSFKHVSVKLASVDAMSLLGISRPHGKESALIEISVHAADQRAASWHFSQNTIVVEQDTSQRPGLVTVHFGQPTG